MVQEPTSEDGQRSTEDGEYTSEETDTGTTVEVDRVDDPESMESDPRSGPPSGNVTGTTPREESALRRARKLSNLLDNAVRVPGTNYRVGLDPVLGILPVAGDSVSAALSLYPVFEAYRLDAPRGTIAKMLALVGVDFVVGSVPVLGPVFDAVWKANEWNVGALERHVEQR